MLIKKKYLGAFGGVTVLLVTCWALFFYNHETRKIDLLSGIGYPGEKWEKRAYNGQFETVEFVYGDAKINPLRGARNAHIKNVSWDPQGKKIFDLDFFYDSFGRRIVIEDKVSKIKKAKFALFFGCMDLLGVGVNSVDTIPSIFSSRLPEYRSYNYGFPGTALHYVNRSIETIDFQTEVTEKNGLFVYVMTEGHYPKSVGKILHIIRPVMPQYSFEKSNLEYLGSMGEISPFSANLKMYVGTSIFSQFIDINGVTTYSQDDHTFICALMKTAQTNFLKKFPDSRFIILLHKILPQHDREHLRNCAQANGVEYVDAFLPYNSNQFSTDPVYAHPTRAVNDVVVNKLIEYLQSK